MEAEIIETTYVNAELDAELADERMEAEQIVELNAEWWRETPNEVVRRNVNGTRYEYPTNRLAEYPLDKLEDKRIRDINQFCIYMEGGTSTIFDLDEAGNDIIQRGFAVLLMPEAEALVFRRRFESDMMWGHIKLNIAVMIEFIRDGHRDLFINENYLLIAKRPALVTKKVFTRIRIARPMAKSLITITHGYNHHYTMRGNDGLIVFNKDHKVAPRAMAIVTLITRDFGLNDDPQRVRDFMKTSKFKVWRDSDLADHIVPNVTGTDLIGELLAFFRRHCVNVPESVCPGRRIDLERERHDRISRKKGGVYGHT